MDNYQRLGALLSFNIILRKQAGSLPCLTLLDIYKWNEPTCYDLAADIAV